MEGRTDAVILSPHDFLARLCALVPPPRFHLVRYFGVLAARAASRPEVVPRRPAPPPRAQPGLFSEVDLPALAPPPRPPSRHAWAWLLRRVFRVEVDRCPVPDCGGPMMLRYLAKTERNAERRMVELGLAPRPRRRRFPGQLGLPLAG